MPAVHSQYPSNDASLVLADLWTGRKPDLPPPASAPPVCMSADLRPSPPSPPPPSLCLSFPSLYRATHPSLSVRLSASLVARLFVCLRCRCPAVAERRSTLWCPPEVPGPFPFLPLSPELGCRVSGVGRRALNTVTSHGQTRIRHGGSHNPLWRGGCPSRHRVVSIPFRYPVCFGIKVRPVTQPVAVLPGVGCWSLLSYHPCHALLLYYLRPTTSVLAAAETNQSLTLASIPWVIWGRI